jgi:hypothetical protein
MSIFNITEQLKPKHGLKSLRKVDYIVIHHIQAKNATWQDINNWHKNNGWSCAGYNEYIRKDGTVYIMRGDHVGAHCYGFNSYSYGIALEGDFQTEHINQVQYDKLIERIKFHQSRFKDSQVKGHEELGSTACPGKNFPLYQLKKDLKKEYTIDESIQILVDHGIIKSPKYWLANAKRDKVCNGLYVQYLIQNFAKKL